VRRWRAERRQPSFSSPISRGEAAGGGLASGAAHGGGSKSADGRRRTANEGQRRTATICASASGWKFGDLRIAEEPWRRRSRSAGSESTAIRNARKTEPVEVPPPRETVRAEGHIPGLTEYHGRVAEHLQITAAGMAMESVASEFMVSCRNCSRDVRASEASVKWKT
jgi:hypothetical protein